MKRLIGKLAFWLVVPMLGIILISFYGCALDGYNYSGDYERRYKPIANPYASPYSYPGTCSHRGGSSRGGRR